MTDLQKRKEEFLILQGLDSSLAFGLSLCSSYDEFWKMGNCINGAEDYLNKVKLAMSNWAWIETAIKEEVEKESNKLLGEFGIHIQENIPGKKFYVMTLNKTVKGYQGINVEVQIVGNTISELMTSFLKRIKELGII